MTVDWLIASNNAGKSRDLQACLAYAGVTAQPYFNQFDRLTFPAETTTSYVDNAIEKARFGASQLGVPVIADDSGIEIPALPRQFGVTTARDLGVAVSGFDRNQEILQALRQVPDGQRQAVMRATLAAAWPDGRVVVVQGTVAGYLAHFQLGQYSGGFDRLFWLPRYGRTLAEIPAPWRIPLTHRGRAALKLITKL
ncbi:non-canonical purine NTP pyrophosphatase [Lactiplantibacillus pentosus]|uniref:Ham1 family protein n=1 Tax=Lactiplantibacillus pentosus IG1 TaxID=1042160 RepID=G0M582_LACPE|nr:non-canonical purine NTP pyrophosphatase [Lactiplantibacillus pentosus]CCC17398.1 Ham1 family protein [Lactiplantibacillus pentosus IG1]MCT3284144.1 non-canonical purine NTP pyrophosphatase [Lactiplantibacillus pentosus]MCT3302579.1 non-canonical purine NTP pyrophosphatase [Lactiplantibacillus pentosus]PRO76019.1 non-canonical purine NTP pyrophosphatase [Lactiplantibacillus pentosus]PRO77316.1 non-canonical purine NTP pyrophosphatase [Lactiplantibacillus pentosus]